MKALNEYFLMVFMLLLVKQILCFCNWTVEFGQKKTWHVVKEFKWNLSPTAKPRFRTVHSGSKLHLAPLLFIRADTYPQDPCVVQCPQNSSSRIRWISTESIPHGVYLSEPHTCQPSQQSWDPLPLTLFLFVCLHPEMWLINPFTPRSDQPWFSLSVSHQRYIIQYGELGIW